MKIGCTLVAVTDMERSKCFYRDILDLDVTGDFGANVILGDNCIALQTVDTWRNFIDSRDITFGGNTFEIYFEEDDIESFMRKLHGFPDIEYVHPLIEHSWGQRAIRFFDPDHHIIEVGENLVMVVKRYLASGLTIEQTASRMDAPIDYIINIVK